VYHHADYIQSILLVTYMRVNYTCMRVLATSNGLLPSVLNVPADIPPNKFSTGVNVRPDSPAILYCTIDRKAFI
jgi:hypothetical protein